MHCHKTLNKDLKTDSKLSYNRDNLGLKIAADIPQKKQECKITHPINHQIRENPPLGDLCRKLCKPEDVLLCISYAK